MFFAVFKINLILRSTELSCRSSTWHANAKQKVYVFALLKFSVLLLFLTDEIILNGPMSQSALAQA